MLVTDDAPRTSPARHNSPQRGPAPTNDGAGRFNSICRRTGIRDSGRPARPQGRALPDHLGAAHGQDARDTNGNTKVEVGGWKVERKSILQSLCSIFARIRLCDLCAWALIAVFALVLLSGCTREISYEIARPDGTRESFRYRNDGFDTKAGSIRVVKSGEAVEATIENLDSTARAMELAGKALDALGRAK